MNKLLEFGRRVMFYARVLSGYEERRIRNYRLHLEKRLQQARERKAELNKLPEKAILAEVRRMVEEMQGLNKQLEETEAKIEEYFKPIDKQAGVIMDIQMEGEKKSMKQMMAATQEQTLRKIEEAEQLARARQAKTNANQNANAEASEKNPDSESATSQRAQAR